MIDRNVFYKTGLRHRSEQTCGIQTCSVGNEETDEMQYTGKN